MIAGTMIGENGTSDIVKSFLKTRYWSWEMWTGECVLLAIFSEHSCASSRSWFRILICAALESEKSEREALTRLNKFKTGNGGRYRGTKVWPRRSPGDVILRDRRCSAQPEPLFGIVRYQDARHISQSQEPYKNLAYSYRQRRLPPALQSNCDPADSILPHRHHSPIRRQSHRLHTQQGSARGCLEHLLLDTQHVYYNRGLSKERRLRSALSRHRQF